MHITEIRIAGFKSFVDPTEFAVDQGLTGIVGPNGCGKSNLLEALRWAMGANSAKAMRGGEMDDLIFSGSEGRPARELAEVTLVLDNSSRTAPPAFNDSDTLEVTRRLKRGAGSTYKLNGRTVRGKDIQLIFADASTGANSPALVRQGQISELIGSKPQNRRRILEEAAGIAGLNTRRHEAELRLRAAEANLERLTEVSAEVERQLESLKRQARKARKYTELSERIAALEAFSAHLRWTTLVEQALAAEAAMEQLKSDVERTTREAALADNAALKARDQIAPLRERETEASGKVGAVKIALARIEAERKAANDALDRLKTDLERLQSDITSQEEQAADASRTVQSLTERLNALEKPDPERERRETEDAEASVQMAATEVRDAEDALDKANAALATTRAQIEAARARIESETRRRTSLEAEKLRLAQTLDTLPDPASIETEAATLREQIVAAGEALKRAETLVTETEGEISTRQTLLEKAQSAFATADESVRELESEARGLERLLTGDLTSNAPAIVDEMQIEKGFEKAVVAALGDDLKVTRDRSAALYWDEGSTASHPALPDGTRALSEIVTAPASLTARLSQCGIVSTADGERLRQQLKTGQRLVTKEGHLWRWDGFTRTPAAPLSEAERLRQKARLDEINTELKTRTKARTDAESELQSAREALKQARDTLISVKSAPAEHGRTLGTLREKVIRTEQSLETASVRRQSTEEALARVTSDLEDLLSSLAPASAAPSASTDLSSLQAAADNARTALQSARQSESEARTARDDLRRSREQAEGRRRGISRDLEDWRTREKRAVERLAELRRRHQDTSDSLKRAETPASLVSDAERLAGDLATLEKARQVAADTLAEAETGLRQAEEHARRATADASQARESIAAAKATLDSTRERRAELQDTIQSQFFRAPDGLLTLARAVLDDEATEALTLQEADREADILRHERNNLGGVNLEAESEAVDLEERLGGQQAEKEDLIKAIAKLREAVHELNEEGRERLLAAFESVNAHFQTLFTTLFRGGQAELRLIEADDPLAAGLEIFAQPPGKRLGTLSLMSGGEQALTATALIFAVFLSNPAPICVLDEVDAPLDDANVDRYCRLLDEMRHRTDTRFVIITHNAVTMSRMDRLFGVTMREKGVSKLVSVDLQAAEDLVAAE